MERKNKNILIGGLIAIVLVMAVGYAAFATQLNITGTSSINSTWNVHFKAGSETVTATPGLNGATTPATTKAGTVNETNAVVYSNENLTATIYTGLQQPGDVVEYQFVIKNESTFSARAQTPILSVSDADYVSADGKIARKGHIQYEITQLPTANVIATNEEATMKVTVTFVNTMTVTGEGSEATQTESATTGANSPENASASITLIYVQN